MDFPDPRIIKHMARRRYYQDDLGNIARLVSGLVILYVLWLLLLYIGDRKAFWLWSLYGVLAIFVVTAVLVLWRKGRNRLAQNHFNKILLSLKQAGREEYIKNFISRFGLENKKAAGWSFRNHTIEWDRINDLKKILKEKGVTTNEKDTFTLLRYFIQEKEEKLTRRKYKYRTAKTCRVEWN